MKRKIAVGIAFLAIPLAGQLSPVCGLVIVGSGIIAVSVYGLSSAGRLVSCS
jgi:hypothetical protein